MWRDYFNFYNYNEGKDEVSPPGYLLTTKWRSMSRDEREEVKSKDFFWFLGIEGSEDSTRKSSIYVFYVKDIKMWGEEWRQRFVRQNYNNQ